MTDGTVELPLEIAVWHTQLEPADEALIRRCTRRLPAFFSGLRACRVAVDAPSPRRGEHPTYTAQVELALPVGAITVVEPPARDRFVVIQEAFDAASRELQSYALRHRYHTHLGRTSP
ncbi:MAG TPA: hypothetical protein VEU74_13285 [Gemmatimonadales bacterium]|nr:hypothetical protein [Gemmatimonadales bacterium]